MSRYAILIVALFLLSTLPSACGNSSDTGRPTSISSAASSPDGVLSTEPSTTATPTAVATVAEPTATAEPAATPKAELSTSGLIVFASARDGDMEIFVMNPDGSAQTQLTHNSVWDAGPAWSPDGKRIAYVEQSQPGGNRDLYVMDWDGSNVTALTDFAALQLDVSAVDWMPDGQSLLVDIFSDEPNNGGHKLFTINADGANLQVGGGSIWGDRSWRVPKCVARWQPHRHQPWHLCAEASRNRASTPV